MAFDATVFKTRTLSAILFGIIMLVGLFSNEWAFIVLFFVIHFLCLREYTAIVSSILQIPFSRNEKVNFLATGIGLFLLVCSMPLQVCQNSVALFLQSFHFYFLGIFIGALLIFLLFVKSKKSFYLLTGLGYISLSLGLLVQLRFQSLLLPLALILFIWMNDTMAYISGSFIGKTPFAPHISPKKTWEGTIGGIICSLLFVLLWAVFTRTYTIAQWIGIGCIASIVGTIGDLVESKLKRMAGVKDSGNMMPGHGGALDRFDSILLAAPIAFLFALFFMQCLEVNLFGK